ncbi:hypothetical protein NDU88_000938 [Pleurodeles waltl]|uniref:Cystatin fetuin-A-type domain-containing protein n=1 Tax=Pleurodeles waltl TaxID=8319 RepID=A0AAV7LBB3_PLEWA|nr:hypothetical protein NDU88_000938 [Pleurodeles waltl]
MKLFVAAILAAQLLSCTAVSLLPSPTARALDCDDPETEAAAWAAITHINANQQQGYKHTLNRIESVKILLRRSNEEVFILELDLLETTCHALSPTLLDDCPVRPLVEHAVEGDCDVKLSKLDGNFTVIGYRCKSEPDSAEDIASICPDCPVLAPLNDTQVAQAVDTLLQQVNSPDDNVYFLFHEIGRARIWTVPENSVELEFVVVATNCTTEDAKNATESCVRLSGDDEQYGFCVGIVQDDPELNLVNCTSFKPKVAVSAHPGPLGNPAVAGHSHHHFHHVHLTSSSEESSSSEMVPPTTPPAQPADPTAANVIVKRSLVVEPIPAVPFPVCPGKTRFFKV